MKLVLVAGFKPSNNATGPNVLLGAGKWRLVMENHKDSILVLRRLPSKPDFIIDPSVIQTFDAGETPTSIGVNNAGTEEFINVFAEMVN